MRKMNKSSSLPHLVLQLKLRSRQDLLCPVLFTLTSNSTVTHLPCHSKAKELIFCLFDGSRHIKKPPAIETDSNDVTLDKVCRGQMPSCWPEREEERERREERGSERGKGREEKRRRKLLMEFTNPTQFPLLLKWVQRRVSDRRF